MFKESQYGAIANVVGKAAQGDDDYTWDELKEVPLRDKLRSMALPLGGGIIGGLSPLAIAIMNPGSDFAKNNRAVRIASLLGAGAGAGIGGLIGRGLGLGLKKKAALDMDGFLQGFRECLESKNG